jgi:hypothetical protein
MMKDRVFKAVVYGPAGRPRAKCSFTSPRTRKEVTFLTSDDSGSWRQKMAEAMLLDKPDKPLDGPVLMELDIYESPLMAHFKAGGGLKSTAPTLPDGGMSIDSVASEVLEAAQIAGWLVDKSRVSELHVSGRYTSELFEPDRVEITMTLLGDFQGDNDAVN